MCLPRKARGTISQGSCKTLESPTKQYIQEKNIRDDLGLDEDILSGHPPGNRYILCAAWWKREKGKTQVKIWELSQWNQDVFTPYFTVPEKCPTKAACYKWKWFLNHSRRQRLIRSHNKTKDTISDPTRCEWACLTWRTLWPLPENKSHPAESGSNPAQFTFLDK